MIYYAVIDTNVLISALLSKHEDSATVQVIKKLFSEEIIPVYSTEIIAEYYEVLHRKKFNFSNSTIALLLNTIIRCGIKITPSFIDEELIDMKDLPFYAVTMDTREKDSYLITGNQKHFPQRPYIVNPSEFLNIINRL